MVTDEVGKLREQKEELTLENSRLKRSIKISKDELEEIHAKRNNSIGNIQKEKSEEHSRALVEYIKEHQQPIVVKQNKLNAMFEKFKNDFNRDMKAITKESVEAEYIEGSQLGDLVDCINDIKKRIGEIIGVEFSENLYRYLVPEDVYIDVETSEDVLLELENLRLDLQYINNVNMDKGILNSLSLFEFEGLDALPIHKDFIYVLAMGGVFAITIFIGAWLYVPIFIIIALLLYRNASNSWLCMKVLQKCRQLELNIDEVRKLYMSEVENIMEKMKKDLIDDMEDTKREYADVSQKLDLKMAEIERDCKKSFVFDEEEFRRKRDNIESQMKARDGQLRLSISESEKAIESNLQKIKTIDDIIKEKMAVITDEYMPKTISDSFELPTKYLIDLIEDHEVIWNYNLKSAMFIYEDKQVIDSLMKLFIWQTYARMKPGSVNIKLIDTVEQGWNFSVFNDMRSKVFEIVKTPKGYNDLLKDCLENSNTRKFTYFKGVPDIFEYNRQMLEEDNVPETYEFNIFLSYEKTLLDSKDLASLARVADSTGVFCFLCVDKKTLERENPDSFTIHENFSTIYTVNDTSVSPVAKRFVDKLLR